MVIPCVTTGGTRASKWDPDSLRDGSWDGSCSHGCFLWPIMGIISIPNPLSTPLRQALPCSSDAHNIPLQHSHSLFISHNEIPTTTKSHRSPSRHFYIHQAESLSPQRRSRSRRSPAHVPHVGSTTHLTQPTQSEPPSANLLPQAVCKAFASQGLFAAGICQ